MRRKANGKAGSPRLARTAADDPGFTATEASSSRSGGSKSGTEPSEDRESGLKQGGVGDEGGAAPRRKTGK